MWGWKIKTELSSQASPELRLRLAKLSPVGAYILTLYEAGALYRISNWTLILEHSATIAMRVGIRGAGDLENSGSNR